MAAPVSVVVVSRGRPQALVRCLVGVGQLDYPDFEIVVVACPDGMAALARRQDAPVKRIPFDEANISAARNLGIAAAAGEIVAFIDDDAVPEPLWLQHLIEPFDDPTVAAAGGYVIGRNGISLQWGARAVDRAGGASPLDMPGSGPVVRSPRGDLAIRTEGTNMAVRRQVLAALGGFDPAFRFYLDDTDLNRRLADAGHRTAIVPLAGVHHGFAASDRRAADRTPRDLSQIGASQMVFLRKHCAQAERDAAWRAFRADQRARLLRYMQRGPLGPDGVVALLRGLDRGAAEGLARALSAPPPLPGPPGDFQHCAGRIGAPRQVLSGRLRSAAELRGRAAEMARQGTIVTLLLFSAGMRPHRVRFDPAGYWEQSGGLYGRSDRGGARLRWCRFRHRVDEEIRRVAGMRGIGEAAGRSAPRSWSAHDILDAGDADMS